MFSPFSHFYINVSIVEICVDIQPFLQIFWVMQDQAALPPSNSGGPGTVASTASLRTQEESPTELR